MVPHSHGRSHRSLHLQRSSLVGYDDLRQCWGREYVFFRPRLFYQSHVRLFTAKTFGHLSDRAKKKMIDRVLTLEHYTPNEMFVSRKWIIAFAPSVAQFTLLY